jgi:hypothetical protein
MLVASGLSDVDGVNTPFAPWGGGGGHCGNMKVVLRLGRGGFYYAGREHWVRDREHALDLGTIERAIALGREVDLESMQVVASAGDASSDWFLPLRRRGTVDVQVAPASVRALLRNAA